MADGDRPVMGFDDGPAAHAPPLDRGAMFSAVFGERQGTSAARALLDARHLTIGYGTGRTASLVVKDVSLTLAHGEVIGIVGESGSGKTTLGRALLGLVKSTSGTIVFDGQDITRLDEAAFRPLRRRMQMIFQDPMASLNPRHTIQRILTGPLLLHGVARNGHEAVAVASETLERVGLPLAALKRYPARTLGRAAATGRHRARRDAENRISCWPTRSCRASMSRRRRTCCGCSATSAGTWVSP